MTMMTDVWHEPTQEQQSRCFKC